MNPALTLSRLLPTAAGLTITTCILEQDQLQVTVVSTRPAALCPACGTASVHVHSRYGRQPADLPWGGRAVRWALSVRRFRCLASSCPRRTFGERFTQVVSGYQRQTLRLQGVLEALGLAVGGEGGARLAQRLSISVSPDTRLRRVKRLALPPIAPLQRIGVDDWAFRRGHRYGTLRVDLDRHRVVDLLPDRKPETLAAWLRQYPGIMLISRDRAGAYAEGARAGAPQAGQVADRWHLLKNLRERVERVLSRHHQALRQAALASDVTPEPAEAGAVPEAPGPVPEPEPVPAPLTRAQQAQCHRRERRLARYQEVLQHHQAGMTRRAIARLVGLDRRTVRRYLRAGRFPERASRAPRPSQLDPFRAYLQQRWAMGCHNATRLFQEIAAQGFTGRPSIVRQALQAWRQPQAALGPDSPRSPPPAPSPRQASGWLLELATPPAEAQEALRQQRFITRLCETQAEISTVRTLANTFIRLVRQRQAGQLSTWLTQARDSAIQELQGFAAGLQQDLAAVSAALASPWSNAQTEGHVNRLKCIKRMMYGRAGFELLRLRVLHPV